MDVYGICWAQWKMVMLQAFSKNDGNLLSTGCRFTGTQPRQPKMQDLLGFGHEPSQEKSHQQNHAKPGSGSSPAISPVLSHLSLGDKSLGFSPFFSSLQASPTCCSWTRPSRRGSRRGSRPRRSPRKNRCRSRTLGTREGHRPRPPSPAGDG